MKFKNENDKRDFLKKAYAVAVSNDDSENPLSIICISDGKNCMLVQKSLYDVMKNREKAKDKFKHLKYGVNVNRSEIIALNSNAILAFEKGVGRLKLITCSDAIMILKRINDYHAEMIINLISSKKFYEKVYFDKKGSTKNYDPEAKRGQQSFINKLEAENKNLKGQLYKCRNELKKKKAAYVRVELDNTVFKQTFKDISEMIPKNKISRLKILIKGDLIIKINASLKACNKWLIRKDY